MSVTRVQSTAKRPKNALPYIPIDLRIYLSGNRGMFAVVFI